MRLFPTTAKHLVKDSFLRFGINLSRFRPLRVAVSSASDANVSIDESIIDEIARFFGQISPFYSEEIPAPLQIAGAWQGELVRRRGEQISAIESRDWTAYKQLLDMLFRSQLMSGMWNHGYYGESAFVPQAVIKDIQHFEVETGRLSTDLIRKAKFSSEWGVPTGTGIIRFVDPYHGRQAQRVLLATKFLAEEVRERRGSQPDVVVDLGSGFGGMASYFIEWCKSPHNLMLVDIPLNLTSAYAYLAAQFKDIPVKLVSSVKDLRDYAPSNEESSILLVPTILLEEALRFVRPVILHNSASFSEMDLPTVKFYLDLFKGAGTRIIIETNSGLRGSLNSGSHREVNSWDIEDILSNQYGLMSRVKVEDVRYVTSTYLRK